MKVDLRYFIGPLQFKVLKLNCQGEEGQYFIDLLEKLKKLIQNMPDSYETENQNEDEKIAYLHYFKGASDWYIFEKDNGWEDGTQYNAFGFACLNGDGINAELGYINIQELIDLNVELDLHYTPQTYRELLAQYK